MLRTPPQGYTQFYKKSRNLFNKDTRHINYFIWPSGGSGGQLESSTGNDCSDFISVIPSTAYVKNVRGHVAWYTSVQVFISGIHEDVALAGVSFTAPVNAAYVRFAINKGYGYSANIAQFELGTTTTQYISYGNYYAHDANKIPSITVYDNEVGRAYNQRKYVGKVAHFIGDSITSQDLWQPTVVTTLGFSLHRNYGVGGSRISYVGDGSSVLERYSAMFSIADIIFVLGGTNDFGANVPLGVFASTTNTEFRGALRLLIEGLFAKYSTAGKLIIFGTLVPRFNPGDEATNWLNGLGLHPRDYSAAIREICADYAVPVVDLYADSGINIINRALYLADGVHPNATGAGRMAQLVISKLNTL